MIPSLCNGPFNGTCSVVPSRETSCVQAQGYGYFVVLHTNHLYPYTVHDTSSVPSSTEIGQHFAEVDEGIVLCSPLIAVSLSLFA